jgi:hypothetical protein
MMAMRQRHQHGARMRIQQFRQDLIYPVLLVFRRAGIDHDYFVRSA